MDNKRRWVFCVTHCGIFHVEFHSCTTITQLLFDYYVVSTHFGIDGMILVGYRLFLVCYRYDYLNIRIVSISDGRWYCTKSRSCREDVVFKDYWVEKRITMGEESRLREAWTPPVISPTILGVNSCSIISSFRRFDLIPYRILAYIILFLCIVAFASL